MDLPRSFTIRESHHRIHNPFDDAKLATLGRALRLQPGTTILDLACGTGELLCTWAGEHGVVGTGVDISTVSVERARLRAVGDELAGQFRAELDTAPLRYVRYLRPYLGWGVFALKRR